MKAHVSQLPPKFPRIHEHQFHPTKLHKILEKEKRLWTKKRPIMIEMHTSKDALQRQLRRENAADIEEKLESLRAKHQKKLDAMGDLTDSEKEQKAELLEKGFNNWNVKDFQAFIRASANHGRDNVEAIAEEMRSSKTAEEVRDYHEAFWKKYERLKDWERHLQVIEEGEQRRQKHKKMLDTLDKYVSQYEQPLLQLVVPGETRKKKTAWTSLEDAWLVAMTQKLGYGNWKELVREVAEAPVFRFDFWIRSRTINDLQKRVDTLLRVIEKQEEEREEGENKKDSKGENKKDSKGENKKDSKGENKKDSKGENKKDSKRENKKDSKDENGAKKSTSKKRKNNDEDKEEAKKLKK